MIKTTIFTSVKAIFFQVNLDEGNDFIQNALKLAQDPLLKELPESSGSVKQGFFSKPDAVINTNQSQGQI